MQHAWVKRRQAQAAVPPVTEKDTRRQLAWAAGSEFFSHRDPLYHITEDFRQTFDEIGRRHAAALAKRHPFLGRWGLMRRYSRRVAWHGAGTVETCRTAYHAIVIIA